MRLLLLAVTLAAISARAQFTLQTSNTTASLRGIDAVSPQVAWASGTVGTVLRTEDGGTTWQACPVPKGAEKLDFRGVQAFDAATAVVMASGKGSASKVYRTQDACRTWQLVFSNPDPEGFFDALRKVTSNQMYLMGDPVAGKFAVFFSKDAGQTWFIADDPGLDAQKGDGAFAASNSSFLSVGNTLFFGTGGGAAAHVFSTFGKCPVGPDGKALDDVVCPINWRSADTPLAAGSAGAGVFSLAGRITANQSGKLTSLVVAVGGDYVKPELGTGTAATSRDGGHTWTAAATPPSGYRSAVAFSRATQTWLAVGPTGSDLSIDDGKTWKPLPGDTATGWNALSLPFVVGPKGRIGKLNPAAK